MSGKRSRGLEASLARWTTVLPLNWVYTSLSSFYFSLNTNLMFQVFAHASLLILRTFAQYRLVLIAEDSKGAFFKWLYTLCICLWIYYVVGAIKPIMLLFSCGAISDWVQVDRTWQDWRRWALLVPDIFSYSTYPSYSSRWAMLRGVYSISDWKSVQ